MDGDLIAITEPLLGWYDANRRDLPWRKTKDPYAIWVFEAMLQQTQVATVIPYYQRFMERFRGVRELADASEDEVLKAWEGLGHYLRARTCNSAVTLCPWCGQPADCVGSDAGRHGTDDHRLRL